MQIVGNTNTNYPSHLGDVADNIFLLLIRKMESGSLMLLWKRNLVYNCINAVIYNNYEKYSFSGD